MKPFKFLRWIGVSIAGCLTGFGAFADSGPVRTVDSVAMTVGNLDVSRAFYENVLKFKFVSETEVSGDAYEHLYGVFGARLRIATLRLGDETLQLEQFLAPQGRPFPGLIPRLAAHIRSLGARSDNPAHLWRGVCWQA